MDSFSAVLEIGSLCVSLINGLLTSLRGNKMFCSFEPPLFIK